MPHNLVVGIWVIVIVVQVLRKYMIIGYLDPKGRFRELASHRKILGLRVRGVGRTQDP